MMPNPWLILSAVVVWLVTVSGGTVAGYVGGKFVQRAEYTQAQLAAANRNLVNSQRNQDRADKAGAQHESNVQVVRERTREIVRTVQIPPDADPYLPVWFVRLFDRYAGRSLDGDPYPGKPEGDPSDVRLSEARSMLARWSDDYYACRQQVADIVALDPVLPAAPLPERKSFFDRLNPF